MSEAAPAAPAPLGRLDEPHLRTASRSAIFRQLILLAAPVFIEHSLHIGVGITDTWLANHLFVDTGLFGPTLEAARSANAAATKAVGTISYVGWFLGIVASSVGIGSTAIIARAVGARHRSLASSVCGQSVSLAVLMGVVIGAVAFVFASPIARFAQLNGMAHEYATSYLRLLGLAMPFSMLMFIAGACLRGAGDTLTPAIAMVVVDVVNIVLSFGLTYGMWGFPRLGFDGIAIGTVAAYVTGGLLLFVVLLRGGGGLRLYLHRLRPHWLTIKRIARIGIPSGLEGILQWFANFGVLLIVNAKDDVVAAAHNNTIRIESVSYMTGFAVATAVATMVGQSLGMKDVLRARRSALAGYALGGGLMGLLGVAFSLFGRWAGGLLSDDPRIINLTAQCLFITGFIQLAFAAAMIFGSALRGAGDTVAAMTRTVISVFGVRFVGAIIFGKILGYGLAAIWLVLSIELCVRGLLMVQRFASGRWQHVRV